VLRTCNFLWRYAWRGHCFSLESARQTEDGGAGGEKERGELRDVGNEVCGLARTYTTNLHLCAMRVSVVFDSVLS
jgi:hypothetical protein